MSLALFLINFLSHDLSLSTVLTMICPQEISFYMTSAVPSSLYTVHQITTKYWVHTICPNCQVDIQISHLLFATHLCLYLKHLPLKSWLKIKVMSRLFQWLYSHLLSTKHKEKNDINASCLQKQLCSVNQKDQLTLTLCYCRKVQKEWVVFRSVIRLYGHSIVPLVWTDSMAVNFHLTVGSYSRLGQVKDITVSRHIRKQEVSLDGVKVTHLHWKTTNTCMVI